MTRHGWDLPSLQPKEVILCDVNTDISLTQPYVPKYSHTEDPCLVLQGAVSLLL